MGAVQSNVHCDECDQKMTVRPRVPRGCSAGAAARVRTRLQVDQLQDGGLVGGLLAAEQVLLLVQECGGGGDVQLRKGECTEARTQESVLLAGVEQRVQLQQRGNYCIVFELVNRLDVERPYFKYVLYYMYF